MNFNQDEERKFWNPYYQIMELSTKELKDELLKWTRLELIDWLIWNDSNGIYRDEDALSEIGVILQKPEAISIIVRQISEGDERLE
ncbi:hypothetical protein BFP78_05380 [Gaetbulibacter sp. 5U11]|nr:hypothetical protein BFP78_05380 [Gaetbulibacter sp. 5U11]